MSLRQWLLLLAACAVGLLGLFSASDAQEGARYAFGLIGFIAAVVYAFALIKHYFDQQDAARH